MSDWVIIRTGASPDASASWARVSDGALVETGRVDNIAGLSTLLSRFGEEARFAAILPGEQAAMRVLPTPPRQTSKLNSAARLLLEDELALPIEDHHIAIARREARAVITAISLDVMQRWVDAFDGAGVSLAVMSVDYLCLDGGRDGAVLFVEGERVAGDLGDAGFAVEADLAEPVIAAWLSEHEGAAIGVYKMTANGPAAGAVHYDYLGESGDKTLLALAAKAIETGSAVNLLQGRFRPARRRFVDASRWRRPAMMAAGLGALMLAGAYADGLRASRLADRYMEEAERIHEEAFPGSMGSIRADARAALAGLGAGGPSFLAVSDALGRALADHDDVSIDRVRYDRTRSQIAFSIRSASDAEIAAFRETLAGLGAATEETGGYRRSGAYWVGDMTVTM